MPYQTHRSALENSVVLSVLQNVIMNSSKDGVIEWNFVNGKSGELRGKMADGETGREISTLRTSCVLTCVARLGGIP